MRVLIKMDLADASGEHSSLDSQNPKVFWTRVRQLSGYVDERYDDSYTPEKMESRIRNDLPINLRERLLEHLPNARETYSSSGVVTSTIDKKILELRAKFIIRVVELRYGSLDIVLKAIGVKSYAAAAGIAVPAFIDLLAMYLPSEMSRVMPGYGLPMNISVSSLPETEEDRAEEADQLDNNENPTEPVGKIDKITDNINRAWLISNTSLVLPVALSLMALYLVFIDLSKKSEKLDAERATVSQEREALREVFSKALSLYQSDIARLNAAIADYVKLSMEHDKNIGQLELKMIRPDLVEDAAKATIQERANSSTAKKSSLPKEDPSHP